MGAHSIPSLTMTKVLLALVVVSLVSCHMGSKSLFHYRATPSSWIKPYKNIKRDDITMFNPIKLNPHPQERVKPAYGFGKRQDTQFMTPPFTEYFQKQDNDYEDYPLNNYMY